VTGPSPGTTDTGSAVSHLGCPVVGNYKALAVAASSSGESPSHPPALLPFHAAGFPTLGGGISTGRRMVVNVVRALHGADLFPSLMTVSSRSKSPGKRSCNEV